MSDNNNVRRSKFFTVPRSTNRFFIGREGILDRLKEYVLANTGKKERQTRIAITGLAGIGKSEICLRLADEVRSKYVDTRIVVSTILPKLTLCSSFASVLWVDVGETAAAEQAFTSVARRLGLQAENLEEALHGISSLEQTWLLFLDNADDPSVDYSHFLPPGSRGVVIMTSRNADCGSAYGCDHWEELSCLSRFDATRLLLRTASIKDSAENQTQAETVVDTLGCHTLAIILAGSYIGKGHCRLGDYCDIYDKNWQRTFSYEKTQDKARFGSVMATFEASMAVLEKDENAKHLDALQILHIIALLASKPVPLAMFGHAWNGKRFVELVKEPDRVQYLSTWHVRRLPELLKMGSDNYDRYRLIEACDLLQSLSLVVSADSDDGMIVSMHPLIRDWVWRRQQHEQMEDSWISTGSLLALSLYHPETPQHFRQDCRVHIRTLVQVRERYGILPSLTLPQMQILYCCADELDDARDDAAALCCLNEIIDQTHVGGESINEEHLGVLKLWARSSLRNGNIEDSCKIWEEIVLVEETLSEDDPARLASRHALAGAYESNGQVEKAAEMLQDVVRVREISLPEDHASRLASQHELARMFEATGQVDKAIELLRCVVGICSRTLEEGDASLLASQHALGAAYEANKETGKAIGLLEHVVCIRESMLEEDHADLLASQHELARAYETDGETAKALQLLEHIVGIEETKLADDHPDRLASQHVLARVYKIDGQFDRAIELLERVVEKRSRLSEDHPDKVASLYELGKAREAQAMEHSVDVCDMGPQRSLSEQRRCTIVEVEA